MATSLRLLAGFACCFSSLAAVPPAALAGSWPQILGPHRNGQAVDETLPERWPAGGPPVQWTYRLGAGYAGPAVVGKHVVVFHRVEDVERVEALDATNGQSRWRTDFPATYRGGFDPYGDLGPRCVPLIHGERVYAFGAAGQLYCLDLQTGRTLWQRDLYGELNASEGYFGAGSTPIVVDQKLLINVGGRDDAGIVALAPDTGKTLWTLPGEDASYSSPTATTIDGKQHAIFVTRYHALSVDPATGKLRFRFPFGQRGPTVNAATPLVLDRLLFVSASYGVGATAARIHDDEADILWSNDETMSSQYTTCVEHGGYLYGTHGRDDVGVGQLRCIDPRTGQVMWSEQDFGLAHLIAAGDRIVAIQTDGQLLLIDPSPKKYRELDRAEVARATVRALPALADGHYYFRTNAAGRGELNCLSVR